MDTGALNTISCLIWTLIAPQNTSLSPAPSFTRKYTTSAASVVKNRHRNPFRDQIPHFLPPHPKDPPPASSLHPTTTYVTSLLRSSNESKKNKIKMKAFEEGSSQHQQTSWLHDLLCAHHPHPMGRHHPGRFGFQPKWSEIQVGRRQAESRMLLPHPSHNISSLREKL